MVREGRTKLEPFGWTANREPFCGPVLAGIRTMDRTTENRTKSPVRTVVLDRTVAALTRTHLAGIMQLLAAPRALFAMSMSVIFDKNSFSALRVRSSFRMLWNHGPSYLTLASFFPDYEPS